MNREPKSLARLLKSIGLKKLVAEADVSLSRSRIQRIEDNLDNCGNVIEKPYMLNAEMSASLGRRVNRLTSQLSSAKEQMVQKTEKLKVEEMRQDKVRNWLEVSFLNQAEFIVEEAAQEGLASQIHASETHYKAQK